MPHLATQPTRRNPLFALLLLVGLAFIATAVLCGMAVCDRYLGTHQPLPIWQQWLASNGASLLASEFVALLAVTFGVAYFEDAQQADLSAAGRRR